MSQNLVSVKGKYVPINKVTYGSVSAAVVLAVSFLLVHFVFHKQLTVEEQTLVVSIVPFVVGWVVAYVTKRDPGLVTEVENVSKLV
jgi:uncharacterized membrane protein